MSINASVLAATAAIALAATGLASAAEARGKGRHVHIKHGHGHHFAFKRHGYHPYVYVADYGGNGCGYARQMWLKTGAGYWKSRYYTCRGWW